MKSMLMLPSSRRYVQGVLNQINWNVTMENHSYLPSFLTSIILFSIEKLSEWKQKFQRLILRKS